MGPYLLSFNLSEPFVTKSFDLGFSVLSLPDLVLHLSAGVDSGIHLGEQKSEHALSVFPLKVVQVHFVAEGLLRLFRLHILARRLLQFLFLVDLLTDFLLDLLEGLQEKLFHLAALIQNDLGECSDIP